ncbi:hypothetical protein HDU96_008705 [Phlyctochytrium bullatum]|nr:hypothetical protein HDU96_008705 [Phlyctochytrium bullatum]
MSGERNRGPLLRSNSIGPATTPTRQRSRESGLSAGDLKSNPSSSGASPKSSVDLELRVKNPLLDRVRKTSDPGLVVSRSASRSSYLSAEAIIEESEPGVPGKPEETDSESASIPRTRSLNPIENNPSNTPMTRRRTHRIRSASSSSAVVGRALSRSLSGGPETDPGICARLSLPHVRGSRGSGSMTNIQRGRQRKKSDAPNAHGAQDPSLHAPASAPEIIDDYLNKEGFLPISAFTSPTPSRRESKQRASSIPSVRQSTTSTNTSKGRRSGSSIHNIEGCNTSKTEDAPTVAPVCVSLCKSKSNSIASGAHAAADLPKSKSGSVAFNSADFSHPKKLESRKLELTKLEISDKEQTKNNGNAGTKAQAERKESLERKEADSCACKASCIIL